MLLVFVFGCAEAHKDKNLPNVKISKFLVKDSLKTKHYSLRKYAHVKAFYSGLAAPVVQLCINENVPPAAVLAMAGLESGWNSGYVGRISGNILSLGARGGDKELPALYLPTSKKTGNVIFDSLELSKHPKLDLIWKNREPSLKKDYRPSAIAGTTFQLGYFSHHPKAKSAAQLQNISDFLHIFISHKSRIVAYKRARQKLDSMVNVHGKLVLLEEKTALMFINDIGGRPNTFNFRKTWPKKVIYILKNAGLVPLSKAIYKDKLPFEKAW
ncbi:MAG: glucosaminidase domain-containing protein [Flavobacteriaceae bacterium]|nr:glucosaminidase domain-containing protein [Flavobacteriaceae bacterium]